MKSIPIFIRGHIGKIKNADGSWMINGITLMDMIDQINPHLEGAEEIHLSIASPGGVVVEGNRIYDYLIGLKKEKKLNIITESIGDIGSMATKIFLAGDTRIMETHHKFFIHNPWTQPAAGDANQVQAEADTLRKSEQELRAFYLDKTGLTEEAIKPFMDEQKAFTSEEAKTLGFVTEVKEPLKAVAFVGDTSTMDLPINTENLTNEVKAGLLDKFLAFFNQENSKPDKSTKKHKSMKNSKVLAATIEARILVTTDAGKIWVDAEDPSKLEGAAVTTVDENDMPTDEAVADGVLTIADSGDKLTIKDGKIVSIEAGTAAKQDDDDDDKPKELEARVKENADAMSKLQESIDAIPAAIDDKINNLKGEISGTYVPDMGSSVNSKPSEEYQPSAVALHMKELEKEHKEDMKKK